MADISQIKLPSGDTFDLVDEKSGYITGMTILSYGSSTWSDFETAYTANKVVYCRASSNANPASGSQTRLAFMAYVNNATTPTNVEFQYYRSVSSHSASQQGDQVYVYKLDKTSGWTVTTREASVKVKIDTNNEGIKTTYSSGTVSIGHANSVTAQTTQAVYPIAYDAQGHITSSGTAVTIPTQASDIGAQPALVSGTNIKTINNNSLLGSGNISINDTYIVNFTYDDQNETWSCDKTAQEIYEAGESGKIVIGRYDIGVYPCVYFADDGEQDNIHYYSALFASCKYDGYYLTAFEFFVNNSEVESNSYDVDPVSQLRKINNKTLETDITLTASDVGALSSSTVIPSKTSDLTNDSGFITSYTETDPTVPAWAKASSKPSYTFSEINSIPTTINGYGITDAYTKTEVDNAIASLPEPMLFKGSLGTGGTITSLPSAAASNEGFVYKVITAGTYASQAAKVGDTFISDGSNWVLIPSGDEPSGTVTSVGVANATNGGLSVSGSPITSSGVITVGLDTAYGDTKNPYGNKTANYVLAGPASGSAAAPSFRALVEDDIPDLSDTYLTENSLDGYIKNIEGENWSNTITLDNGEGTASIQMNDRILDKTATIYWSTGDGANDSSTITLEAEKITLDADEILTSFNYTPTLTNHFVNKGYVDTAINSKQNTLVSGTNIKTINNESLLGSGNITISSGGNYTAGDGIDITSDVISVDSNLTVSGDTAYLSYTVPTDVTKQPLLVSGTNIKTINNSSILGSGNLSVGTLQDVTVDGNSIVNSNNIAALTSGTNVKTINNQSIFGSGNINTNSLIYQKYESSYTTASTNISSIPIGITNYQPTDILLVDADGLTLTEGIDYTINNSTNYITLTNPIEESGTVVHFIALRSGLISGAISLDSLKGDPIDIGTIDDEDGLDDETLLSTATMNKWRNIIGPTTVADEDSTVIEFNYIIDEGKTGDWYYRKWKNGVIEAWTVYSPGSQTPSEWVAGSWYYKNINVSIPSGLFSSAPTFCNATNIGSDYQFMVFSAVPTSATNITVRVVKPNSGSASPVLSIYANNRTY